MLDVRGLASELRLLVQKHVEVGQMSACSRRDATASRGWEHTCRMKNIHRRTDIVRDTLSFRTPLRDVCMYRGQRTAMPLNALLEAELASGTRRNSFIRLDWFGYEYQVDERVYCDTVDRDRR